MMVGGGLPLFDRSWRWLTPYFLAANLNTLSNFMSTSAPLYLLMYAILIHFASCVEFLCHYCANLILCRCHLLVGYDISRQQAIFI